MMYDEKRTGGAGMVEKEEFYLNSTNGVNKLHVISWHPLDEIRAIVQISHGMCEYVDRYDRLATFLAQHGIMVIGNDHLGPFVLWKADSCTADRNDGKKGISSGQYDCV